MHGAFCLQRRRAYEAIGACPDRRERARNRALLQASFEDGGFGVVLTTSGEEAMAAPDSKTDTLRALLTDINLGSEATGWEVARHARELKPDLPVVYMTGADANEWAALGVPNSVPIKKPFAPALTVTAVSQLLNIGNAPSAL